MARAATVSVLVYAGAPGWTPDFVGPAGFGIVGGLLFWAWSSHDLHRSVEPRGASGQEGWRAHELIVAALRARRVHDERGDAKPLFRHNARHSDQRCRQGVSLATLRGSLSPLTAGLRADLADLCPMMATSGRAAVRLSEPWERE